jgi:hypothetical protein
MIHDDDTPNIYGDMPPSRFRFGRSHFGGQPYAQCECGTMFAMFTDDGDLVHDCPIDRPVVCADCGDTIPNGGGIDDYGVTVCRPCHDTVRAY